MMNLLKALAILSLVAAIIYPRVGIDKEKIDVPDILAGFLPEGSLVVKRTPGEFICPLRDKTPETPAWPSIGISIGVYYEVYDQAKELAGFVFPAEGEGYSGEIKFFIFTDTAGKIQKVHVFEHNESPEYVPEKKLNDFLLRLKGKRINQALLIYEDIDAITQATITSFAILEGVNKAGKRAMQIGVLDEEKARPIGGLRVGPQVWGLVFLFFFSLLAYLSRRKALRWAVLLWTLIFLGFIHSYILSLPVLVNILSLRLPSLPQGLFWFLIYGLAVFSVIWAGRFYCGWLCPFGAALDFLSKLNPVRCSGRLIPRGVDKYLRGLKYFLLWGLLFFALSGRNPHLADYEPFATLFTGRGSVISWGYLLFFLISGIFFSRLWCRYFCASGAALAFLSPLSRRKLQVGGKCSRCERCLDVCPMGAISKGADREVKINYSECIECNLCLKICPQKAIVRRRIMSNPLSPGERK